MGEIDIAFTIYVFIIALAFLVGYRYSSYMIRKTGLFLPQTFIAGTIIIAIDIIAILGWSFYSWGTNEFIFIIGIYSGLGLLVLSEGILVTILLIRRKHLVQQFKGNIK